MEVAQLSRDVSVVGGVVEVSVTESCKSAVIPKRAALPKIAWRRNPLEQSKASFGRSRDNSLLYHSIRDRSLRRLSA